MIKFYLVSISIFLTYILLEYLSWVLGVLSWGRGPIGRIATISMVANALLIVPGWIFLLRGEQLRSSQKINILAICNLVIGVTVTIISLFMSLWWASNFGWINTNLFISL